MDLYRNNPNHVAGHKVIRADLGVLGRAMVIISGIARPEWRINDDHIHHTPCVLHLQERVDDLEQWTVSVGLASIGNDDTAYAFATDEATLSVDDSGELVLTTQLALMGEPSALSRFGYQIVCTSRHVTSGITGSISWPTYLFRPTSTSPGAVSGVFTILANEHHVEVKHQQPPLFDQIVETLIPVTPGEIVAVRIAEDQCAADYRIVEPPKGVELKVTVRQQQMTAPPPNSVEVRPVTPNGDMVTLTPLEPTRSGVDFAVTVIKGVK